MELADIHNRRANIETVSKRAKENNFPFLVWPEDKDLLTIADLPTTLWHRPNVPPTWLSLIPTGKFVVRTDEALRRAIREGYAYTITAATNVGAVIHEYKVTSK